MADIALTAAQIAVVFPQEAEIVDVTLTEAVTKGQAGYQLTTGKFGVADANAAGKQQFRGIFLKAGAAGQVVPLLKRGHVYGFTVAAMNGDAIAYLSDTAGALADAAGTMTVNVGRIVGLTDHGVFTKVLFVDADWLRAWA